MSNPFDPLGPPAPTGAPNAQQYGSSPGMGAPPAAQPSPGNYGGMNNYGGTPQSQQYPPQQQYGQNYGMQSPNTQYNDPYSNSQSFGQNQGNPPATPQQGNRPPVASPGFDQSHGYPQQPGTPSQQPAYAQQSYQSNGYNGYGSPQPSASNQLVPSSQPSNPYAGVVAPPAPTDNSGQALVPAAQPASQWGVSAAPGYGQAPAPIPGAGGFDPFAAPPNPSPAPPLPPAPAPAAGYDQNYAQNTAAAPPAPAYNQNPYDSNPAAYQAQAPAPPANENPFASYDNSLIPGIGGPPAPAFAEPPAPAPAPPPPPPQEETRIVPSDQQSQGNHQLPKRNDESSQGRELAVRPGAGARNPYSTEIARRERPPGSSPLPKADLVRKRGYVLSRISFRTIVMKKWKQAYWVQYGSHTMLWFRAEHDFDEWLNNPYHNQAQRNFLIKLAVNFVHDLYKPNVRGYQVTQCRSKPYGNKMVRQFKLERWMDYGPTIAAAFGSYDPKEVDALREAIVECMRNTPLDGGIRATGAVRQPGQHGQHAPPSQGNQGYGNGSSNPPPPPDRGNERHESAATTATNGYARPGGARSVASANDLLDFNDQNAGGFDDTASLPAPSAGHAYSGAPPPQQQSYPGYQQSFPPQQQQYHQQPPPQQQYHQQPAQQQYHQQPPQQQQYNQQPPQQQYHQPSPQQQYQQPGQYPVQQNF